FGLLFGKMPSELKNEQAPRAPRTHDEWMALMPKPEKLWVDSLDLWHAATELRLKAEDHSTALVAWRQMTMTERCGLWNEVMSGLHDLGVEMEKHEHQGLVQ